MLELNEILASKFHAGSCLPRTCVELDSIILVYMGIFTSIVSISKIVSNAITP
jgi:hypothetical protein